MPSISFVRKCDTPPVNLKVAMARRSWSASPGVKPAQWIAIDIACSWNSGTPSVRSRALRKAGVG